jgi:hypothetical protein
VSTYANITVGPKYKGTVLVNTGEQDQAFCGPGSSLRRQGRCFLMLSVVGKVLIGQDMRSFYIGSVEKTFGVADEFLEGGRFEG